MAAYWNLSISSIRHSATIEIFAWSVREKPRNTSVRIASHRTKNRTQHLRNTKWESFPQDSDFLWIPRRLMELHAMKCDMRNVNYESVLYMKPITVAARSKTWTVFARSDAGIVGSNLTEAWMFVYVYSVFVLGSGLAIGWSLIQGALPTVLD
jgi:hypothetical protein